MQAVLEREAPSESLDLFLGQLLETIRPLLNQEFGHEDVPAQPRDPVREFPDRRWVEMPVLLWDFFDNVVNERLVDIPDAGVVCSPCIDGKTVFASEEVFK